MNILLASRAEKELRRISKVDQVAIARKIRSLGDSTVVTHEEKLAGYPNIYRVRVGNYRIVYRKTSKELFIVLIGHRKDIYHLVRQILR